MSRQSYSSEDAFSRWRASGLRRHLDFIRRAYRWRRGWIPPAVDDHPDEPPVATIDKWRTMTFGFVTWGVFARAFWPIYQRGSSPLFFGSVVFSASPEDEDSPALFEVAQEIRHVRDSDVPLDGIESFAHVIRDDHAMAARLAVPEAIAMKPDCYLQSIGIERRKLPGGYLHHRLVPIVTHAQVPYATIVDPALWGHEFTALWRSGPPLLAEADLAEYRQHFPDIVP